MDDPDRTPPDPPPPAADAAPVPLSLDPDPEPFSLDDIPPPPPPARPPAPTVPAADPHASPVRRLLHTAVGFASAFLVLRTLTVEPFGVPTGSMAPTFIGNHREGPCPRCGHPVRVGDRDYDREAHFADACCPNCGKKKVSLVDGPDVQGDRLLVDKNVFSLRPPRRWEVAVFRCPVDLSKPYVKRVVGLPGEVVTIKDGDVYAGGEICRKSMLAVRETRLPFFDMAYAPPEGWGRRWLVSPPNQDPRLPPLTHHGPKPADETVLKGGVLVLDGSASPQATAGVTYRHCDLDESSPQLAEQPVRSWNGYNGTAPRRPTPPPAYDFCVECDVEVTAGAGTFACRLFDGADAVDAEFAAGADAAGKLLVSRDKQASPGPVADVALRPGRTYRLEFAFTDRRVFVALDGREVIAPLDLKPAAKRGDVSRPLQFGVRGCRVEVRNLRLYHDIYYTTTGQNGTRQPCRLGPTEYFMLGDNSGNSQDSREWSDPGVPEGNFIGKPFLVHQPLRPARVTVGGKERVFQTLDWSRLRWLR